MRQFKFIGDLPTEYEYKLIKTQSIIKIIGIHPKKDPIGFILNDNELEQIEINL